MDQELLTLDLELAITVKDLKDFVEAHTGLPSTSQHFFLNGLPLTNEAQTLEQAGIKDGEMLAVLIRKRGNAGNTGPNVRRPAPPTTHPGRREEPDPETLRLHILNDPASQEQLRQRKPELLDALHDPNRWREIFLMGRRQEAEAERERQNQIALLNEDPFNIDAQRKIEEIIRQDRVIENLQHAYEHNPEGECTFRPVHRCSTLLIDISTVFVRVHMLYINTEVNGHPVKAFVDSGAQATIMSPKCAEECGIMRLIDTRYSGIAKGVGTAKILGRVHHAEIKIGGAIMPCAFTVMEGKDVDLLFGLDMLKRYKAKIDLEKNALCFEGIEVPFLPESEIPKNFEEAELNEPTVSGPNGTEIGARSGAVRPAGAPASTVAAGPSTSQPPSAAAPSSSAEEFPEEHIEQLMSLGISRAKAIHALRATGGNLEYAASMLFMQQ